MEILNLFCYIILLIAGLFILLITLNYVYLVFCKNYTSNDFHVKTYGNYNNGYNYFKIK